jgi:hypothetical protein
VEEALKEVLVAVVPPFPSVMIRSTPPVIKKEMELLKSLSSPLRITVVVPMDYNSGIR